MVFELNLKCTCTFAYFFLNILHAFININKNTCEYNLKKNNKYEL